MLLEKCLRERNGWDVLYYAKRISRINANHHKVVNALDRVSGILKSDAHAARSFLELLRADELTEVPKLGHLVERRPGEVICRVGESGKSTFAILRGEVGVYNLEGKGFGGTSAPKHTRGPGEVVGELATALKRTRTADLVAMGDVALLSFITEEVEEKLSATEAGKFAARQYDRFILDRVLQHTIQVAPYLLGPSRRGPLSVVPAHEPMRVGEPEAWEAALRTLLPHTELVTVDPEGFSLEIGQVTRKVDASDPERGLFVLVSGSVESPAPAAANLVGAQCPPLWVNVPELSVKPPGAYERTDEPIMVLWIGAEGIDQLSLQQRAELRRALDDSVGEAPPEYEYDVYLCHSS
ncbi:cyclic nucleotide-binding domain-containing protein [Saccharothrix xinjiangensis]|uniref:Cyclic nucleotide-binding domain-containing protein n=1 Tax=Saccharothrix xinjiangensis TaxID=204798 RepID=A0ABV9XSS7_9PSEU